MRAMSSIVHLSVKHGRESYTTMAAMEATLRALNEGYIRSVRTSDVGWFVAHLADDFVRTCVRIRIFGEIAIIHGRTTYRKADGRPAAGRYTDVWARRD